MRQGQLLARRKVRPPVAPVSGVMLWAQHVVPGLQIAKLAALRLSGLHGAAAEEAVSPLAEVAVAVVTSLAVAVGAKVGRRQVLPLRNHPWRRQDQMRLGW